MSTKSATPAASSSSHASRQREIFLAWVNAKLKRGHHNLRPRLGVRVERVTDFRDGTALCHLIESLAGRPLTKYKWTSSPKSKAQMLENSTIALRFVASKGVRLVGIDATNVHDGDETRILGLLWTLILKHRMIREVDDAGGNASSSSSSSSSLSSEQKSLLKWAQRETDAYVREGALSKIKNLNKAWKDGRAFCALLHAYLGDDAIDIKRALSKDSDLTDAERLKMAFSIAYDVAGADALLVPDDLTGSGTPDTKAVITYLSELKDSLDVERSKYMARAIRAREEAAEMEAEKRRRRESAARKADAAEARASLRAAALRATTAASWAAVFAHEGGCAHADALAVSGTDFWVVVEGPRIGVYMKRAEADRHSGDGRYRVAGFNNFKSAHALALALQGGQELWDKYFGDASDDDDDVDDDDDDDDDDDSDDDDGGDPRRRARTYHRAVQERDRRFREAFARICDATNE